MPKKDNDDNERIYLSESQSVDPRIVAIVRYLARRAAEKDFSKAVAEEKDKNRGKD